jgi:hypothetical protein
MIPLSKRFQKTKQIYKTPVKVNFIAKLILWSFILFLAFYFIVRNAIPHYSLDEAYFDIHWDHAAWLLIHISAGIIALILGPVQFIAGIRRRYLNFHRWSGRIYLISVGVSAIAAVYMLSLPHSSFGFRVGISGLAIAWISTSGLALIAILRKQFMQHKEWMIRSYVVTFGFVFFRVLIDPLMASGIATPEEVSGVVSWLCWSVPLLLTEILLQGRKIIVNKRINEEF